MVTILFIAFVILLLIGVPIAVSLGIASVLAIFFGSHMPLLLLPQKIFNGVNSFPFMAIPLFLLAGNIMAEAKISDRLVGLASLMVGRYPGGLAHVSTGASAFFGAISGSAPATPAAIGSIMIPSMKKRGYSGTFSAAVVAASGALGLIIPPSLTMVVYGVLSGASIGAMFLCGIVPGYLLTDVVMHTCEPESAFYPGVPTVQSVVIACVITFCFSVFIQLLLTRKVRSIDMVEALKSVE